MPTDEFVSLSDYALGELKASRPPEEQEFIDEAAYLLEYRPTPWQLAATNTPKGYRLLGMYVRHPHPYVVIFEENLRAMQDEFGGLYESIKSTLEHEIFQHHYGFDHTLETESAGLIPGFIVPAYHAPILDQRGEPSYA